MRLRIITIFFLLISSSATFTQSSKAGAGLETQQVTKKLIFVDFYNESKDVNTKWLESSIGEAMHDLAKSKYKYERIPPEVWQDYAKRNNYKDSDLYNEDKLQKMGIALKADGIIYGKFISGKDNITINGKILSVVDKEVVAEKDIQTPLTNEMFNNVKTVSETLAERIKDLFYPSDKGALWRSAVLPGWGQHYKQRKTFSYAYGGVIGTGLIFTTISFIIWQGANSDYKNFNPDHVTTPSGETGIKDPAAAKASFAELEAKSQQWEQITIISFGITSLVYAWHLFDAWFFDGDYANAGKALTSLANGGSFYGQVKIQNDKEPFSLKFSYAF